MKRLLIISPYFPPSNTADMQRIRMSLPYFKEFGWIPEVVTVHESYADTIKDELLLKSIPPDIPIHRIKAWSKRWTSKFGLGSLALRSLWFYYWAVSRLLKEKKFDLIYFSTTEFPVTVLGAFWKKRFHVPYVIDMQDPWHSTYYEDKPSSERPPKYWFSYRMNKFLEPIAMNTADGLISVSKSYIQTLQERYPHLLSKPAEVITFGAFQPDFEIAEQHHHTLTSHLPANDTLIHLVYIGRGGYDMLPALRIVLDCLQLGLQEYPAHFERIRIHFIGTSYAPKGQGKPTLKPLADELGLGNQVSEYTDRIGFYESLKTLQNADGLVIIGSDDPAYTASKIYPYVLAKKPLLGVFHPSSSAVEILKTCRAGEVITLEDQPDNYFQIFRQYITQILHPTQLTTDWALFAPYTARYQTGLQTAVFERSIALHQT